MKATLPENGGLIRAMERWLKDPARLSLLGRLCQAE